MPLRPTYPVNTSRLRLRPLSVADIPALVSYHALADVHNFLPFGAIDAENIKARITNGPWSHSTLEQEGDVLVLGVELETGELVGDVMLRWRSSEHQCGEIGYVFHPRHAGHGYATEAARALLGLAFGELDLHRVIARIDPRNVASIAVVERLGMRKEAHLVENMWLKGEWTDEVDYAILESEWADQVR